MERADRNQPGGRGGGGGEPERYPVPGETPPGDERGGSPRKVGEEEEPPFQEAGPGGRLGGRYTAAAATATPCSAERPSLRLLRPQ